MNEQEQRFNDLYQQYKPLVFSIARKNGASQQTAEDVTQEVFLRLSIHLASIQRGQERQWLSTVAGHLMIDLARYIHRRTNYLSLEAAHEQGIGIDIEDAQAENEAATLIDQEAVRDLLQVLPPKYWRKYMPLFLQLAQGYTYKEIAQQSGVSYNLLKARAERGRRTFRRFMQSA